MRLALLEKFGGIWVDATLFCAAPVMTWLDGLKQKSKNSKRHGTELTEPDDTDDQSCGSFEGKDHGFFFVFERDSETWPYDPFLKCNLPLLDCLERIFFCRETVLKVLITLNHGRIGLGCRCLPFLILF